MTVFLHGVYVCFYRRRTRKSARSNGGPPSCTAVLGGTGRGPGSGRLSDWRNLRDMATASRRRRGGSIQRCRLVDHARLLRGPRYGEVSGETDRDSAPRLLDASAASRSWTPAASTPSTHRIARSAAGRLRLAAPGASVARSSRSSAFGEGEAAGPGDPLARAGRRRRRSAPCRRSRCPANRAHRVTPKEYETRIRDGPTGRRAGSRGRSRSVWHRRGGRSPRRDDATRP